MDDDLIKYDETARIIRVPIPTLYSMVSRGAIPHIRISGRLVRFSRRTIMEWLKSKEVSCSTKGGA